MHRLTRSAAVVAALLALSGCGSSGSAPSATGEFGKLPQITLPSSTPPSEFSATVVVEGTGKRLAEGDTVQAHFVGKRWRGGDIIGQTYKDGKPSLFPVGAGQLLPGWEKGLVGQRVGSRVLIVTPPDDAFGATGNLGLEITPDDTLVFAFDLLKAFDGSSSADGTPVTPPAGLPTVTADAATTPAITIPTNYAPGSKLVVQQLRKGSGRTVAKGDTILAQYVGVIAASGKEFDSSWSRSQPASFQIGAGAVIPGWDEGLVGQTEGSRVLMVIPPAKGYGAAGNAGAGISGTDTLIFVVDVLAVS